MIDYALIMLASGLSSRFGPNNKLLSEFRGKPLCSHSARLGANLPRARRIAIVPSENESLERIYTDEGWTTLANKNARLGQSQSLKIGVQYTKDLGVGAIIICLADMPLIDQSHIDRIANKIVDFDALMSQSAGTLMPPAAFKSELFDDLLKLDGDAGAKRVFLSSHNKQIVPLSTSRAIDIDTLQELKKLNAKDHFHA